MKAILYTLLCIFLGNVFAASILSSNFELELLQVLFRHGDRTASRNEVYKNDPYIEYYKKFGHGILTKVGMNREYKIGLMLREHYNEFLGEYNEGEVYAYSTHSPRTKQSLQLVLAGLYPPSKETAWNSDLIWTPIPTYYDQEKFNFLSANFACSTFFELLSQISNLPEVKKRYKKYENFTKEIHKLTGEFFPTNQMYRLYNNLRSALSMGLPLPDWCTEEMYETIKGPVSLSFRDLTHTPLMTRIATGPTVEKFLENIEKSGKGLDGRKIYLYGAHEINIAQFCNANNFTEVPNIPDYGSTLILKKLRGPNGQIYVSFAMWTGAGEEFIPINVKGCGYECPLSKYKSLVASILPDEVSRSCFPTTCNTNPIKSIETERIRKIGLKTNKPHPFATNTLEASDTNQ